MYILVGSNINSRVRFEAEMKNFLYDFSEDFSFFQVKNKKNKTKNSPQPLAPRCEKLNLQLCLKVTTK